MTKRSFVSTRLNPDTNLPDTYELDDEHPLPKETASVLKEMRNAAIEECAQLAEEQFKSEPFSYAGRMIAAAIRALKSHEQ